MICGCLRRGPAVHTGGALGTYCPNGRTLINPGKALNRAIFAFVGGLILGRLGMDRIRPMSRAHPAESYNGLRTYIRQRACTDTLTSARGI